MARVANKVAIVTGAAMGIGKACAELLAAEGAAVAVTDREIAAGKDVSDLLSKAGCRAIFIEHDVSREDHWERVVAEVLKALHQRNLRPCSVCGTSFRSRCWPMSLANAG